MKKQLSTRIFSLLMALTLLCGYAVPVQASDMHSKTKSLNFEETEDVSIVADVNLIAEETTEEPEYAPEEIVRVSIVLEERSTLDAGFSTMDIAQNQEAMSYRDDLKTAQAQITAKIEASLDSKLDVQWNLTLAANIISANVEYGWIEEIQAIPGVKEVVLENQYEPCVVDEEYISDPNTATSRDMIGTSSAYAVGYTGTGGRVAIIDTGLDTDHQSFAAAGYEYSLALQAAAEGMTLDAYMEEKDLLTAEKINAVIDQLNASEMTSKLTGDELYKTSKIPFGYNYVDTTHEYIDHNLDYQGGHGSHVAGIAGANSYIHNGAGTFSQALDAVGVQGVAPDAQILVMKIFGVTGGAYESDYVAAIEDAIILGCDSVNLSLGSAFPGFVRSTVYEELLDSLVESDTMVVISAGNSGHWADASFSNAPGYLYIDDVSMYTGGAPGSYTNSLAVASADNDGGTGYYFAVNGKNVVYAETEFSNALLRTIAGDHEYIFIDGFGTDEDFAAVADVLKGKVALCSRGGNAFYEKANNAVKYGASAVIIYNNEPGAISMDLTDYTGTAPCVSITQSDGNYIRSVSTPITDENNTVLYYTGTLTVGDAMGAGSYNSDFYAMSSFSSYGVPSSLEMKPEITAPGGNIYSVDGEIDGGTAYVTMSGTSMSAPQIAGMAALVGQYIDEWNLEERTGLTRRALSQSLLMSTAKPMLESEGIYYPIVRQGAGLADVGAAVTANSYILMNEDATGSWADGKVKVELKDDPEKTGTYEFGFTLNNLKDDTQKYMLSAEMFTQGLINDDTYVYMNTSTVSLRANVTWTVDGMELKPATDVSRYDFNGDGLVNSDDVQALLDYAVGLRTEITNAELADFDANSEINTYDAYLLLDKLNTGLVALAPGGMTEVRVKIVLTDEQKAELDAHYENGAYVEGFIIAEQLSTTEGVLGTTHSIPVLGYYGSWTDPSMYDQGSYAEVVYGTAKPSYTGEVTHNTLTVEYPNRGGVYYTAGNPYLVEDKYPAGREAINIHTNIYQQYMSTIRNSAALTVFITNQDGEYLYFGNPVIQDIPAFYYINGGYWAYYSDIYTLNKSPHILGAQEGDTITVSMVAIPELYETDGDLTVEQIKELIERDALGDGAYLTNTFKVDSQAPEMRGIHKDLATGNLVIETWDNNYVAAVQVRTKGGKVLATVIPEQVQAGETTYTTIDLSAVKDMIGPECIIGLGDYAANEVSYLIDYGGEPIDYSGKMFGFTGAPYRGDGYRWMQITPEKLWYYNTSNYEGTENLENIGFFVTAAEYVGGYIYMATDTGYFYVGEQGAWGYCYRGAYYLDSIPEIKDMAFNYNNNTLYALSNDNTLYSVDLYTTEVTKVATISITNPFASWYRDVSMLAIDDDGNFYVTCSSGASYSCLYTFTLDQITDGALALEAVSSTNKLGYATQYGSMTWDHDEDILYMAGSSSSDSSYSSYLIRIDPESGIGQAASSYAGEYDAYYASKLQVTVRGLYVVPVNSYKIEPRKEAVSLTLDRTEIDALVGAQVTLNASVFPWNLEDKSVTWTSSDNGVATVDDGVVTLVGSGTATITATTNAEPHLTATCSVISEKLPNTKFTGLIYDKDGTAYWADFETDNLENWTAIAEASTDYLAGGFYDGTIYLHDGSNMYTVDSERFIEKDHGAMVSSWLWSDVAEAPAVDGAFGNYITISTDGKYVAKVNPADSSLSYWNMGYSLGSDSLAAIAYARTGTYDYYIYRNSPAHWYYAITEAGNLWEIMIFGYKTGSGYVYQCNYTNLGSTGLNLDGVADITGGQHASMIYDQSSGYLLLSAYITGNTNVLYAINTDNLMASQIGDFGNGVWPVTALYQYERTRDLTVELDITEAEIYAEDTIQITATVVPLKYRNEVTWTTSDPEVAVVDANGMVTGMKGGIATITATSVDADSNGAYASASCTITVKDLAVVESTVGAQIVTESGAQWVTVDTKTRNITVHAENATTLTGAGEHNGKIYGTDSDFASNSNFYMVDPGNDYAETIGSECASDYAVLDLTTAPERTVTLTDDEGNAFETTAFGYPVFITYNNTFGMLQNYMEGSSMAWTWGYYYGNIGALAYIGDSTYTNGSMTYDTEVFYALAASGNIYKFQIYPVYSADAENHIAYGAIRETIGNIGISFMDFTKMTMTHVSGTDYDGLIVGYTSNDGAELYYVDLVNNSLHTTPIGKISGASAISGLYTVDHEATRVEGTRIGDNIVASSEFSLEAELPVAMESDQLSFIGDQSSGGLNAVTVRTVTPDVAKPENDCGTGKTTVTLTADEASTNGIVTVEYDAAKLTLESIDSAVDFQSVIEEAGKVTFGYVNAEALTDIATLTFTVKEESAVTVTTLEENDSKPGTTQTLTVTAPQHDDKVIDSKAATCTEDGYNTYECAACGHKHTEVLPALGHDLKTTVVAPTCEQDGYTLYECARCDLSYRDDIVAATGHDYTATVTEPTCTTAGYTTYTCACGDSYKDNIVEAKGHDWSDWTVTREATCDEAGSRERICNTCGEKQTEDILPTGHDYTSVVIEATCDTAGYTQWTCTCCGNTYMTDIVEALGHDFSDWTETKAPTCTEKGEEKRECARCDVSETRETDALGHSYAAETVAPTCTEEGYTKYTCAVCGDVYYADIVETLGHTYEAVVTEPTCTEQGYTTYTCTVCGDTYVADYTEPDCPSAGYTDVPLDQWYHEAVDYVIGKGLMKGMGDGIFAPNGITTRAQLVTVLYRMAGEPQVELTQQFTDVKAEAWYAEAVAWAYANGITTGITQTLFAPDQAVSREQMVTFLYRYTDVDTEPTGDLSRFPDADKVSSYARDAMTWAVENGIITGMEDGTLAPRATSTRAQIATILMRYCQTAQ